MNTNTNNKKYYKIGEISKHLNIEPHVLRFWETKFPQLKPKKNKSSGHRRYTQKDFDLIIKIHDLLYNKNFRIEGAIKKLSNTKDLIVIDSSNKTDLLFDKDSIKEELIALKKLIEDL
jgi:DNA-binding transcriptional MerR regulator